MQANNKGCKQCRRTWGKIQNLPKHPARLLPAASSLPGTQLDTVSASTNSSTCPQRHTNTCVGRST